MKKYIYTPRAYLLIGDSDSYPTPLTFTLLNMTAQEVLGSPSPSHGHGRLLPLAVQSLARCACERAS